MTGLAAIWQIQEVRALVLFLVLAGVAVLVGRLACRWLTRGDG